MLEFDRDKTPAISITDERRKSSPECFFPFILESTTPPSSFLLQKKMDDNKDQDTSNWIRSRKQSFKEVFNSNKHPLQHNNNNKAVLNTSPPSPPITPFDINNNITNTRFLRSYSETRYSPPFSSISSSNSSSYFSSSSYANSITLPAPPIIGGATFSSLKKKKKRLLQRTSITGTSSEELFQTPTSDTKNSIKDKQMLMMSSVATADKSPHRNSSDIELATEIGQGLLSEVRRMQSILQERQDTLITLELERTDNQQRIDDLIKQLRYKNEIEERLKEDIWNLELTKQDLSHQIRQLSQNIAKSQIEQAKRERQSSLVNQEVELLKASQLNWQEMMNNAQTEYDATLLSLNNQLITLKKEKDVIALQLEQLSKEKINSKREQEDDKSRKISEKEIQLLQVSLGQAHSVVESLQLDLEKEKQKKIEVDALLRESQETIESMQKTSSASDTWCQDVKSSVTVLSPASDSSSSSLEQEIESAENRILPTTSVDEQFGSIVIRNPSTHHMILPTHDKDVLSRNHNPSSLSMHTSSLATSNEFEKVLPFVMHTMIGEWLLKFTRNRMGNGISNKSHQRFFWLHPYTKTLYWSQQEPGVRGGEYKAKSVSIDSFFVDQQQLENRNQPVIVIKSSVRDIRLQCINKDSHEKWVQSLKDLLKDEENLTAVPQQHQKLSGNNKTLNAAKSKRLSLLLENAPPSTIRQKKNWRLSEANLDISPGQSSIRFNSLSTSHK